MTKKISPEPVYDTGVVIQVEVTYHSRWWISLTEIFSNGRRNLVFLLLQWINAQKHTKRRMSNPKTLLTGKAKSAISGIRYFGQVCGAAWIICERKFGRPHLIIDAQLESLCKTSHVKPTNSTHLISISVFVSKFVNVLEEWKPIGDLQSSSTHWAEVDNLPDVLKEKCWFYVEDKDEDWPDLIILDKWISKMSFLHGGFSVFKKEQKEGDRRSRNREKWLSKISNLSASSKVNETKQIQTVRQQMALTKFLAVHFLGTWAWMIVTHHWGSNVYEMDAYAKDMQSRVVKSMRLISMDASRSTTHCHTQKNNWTRAITQSKKHSNNQPELRSSKPSSMLNT